MKKTGYLLLLILCAGLCACSSPQRSAPIVDRSTAATSSNPRQFIDKNIVHYTVQKGDTLLKISRRSGHNMSELASWNHLNNLNDLKVGQVLQLQPSADGVVETASITPASQVEVRSIDEAKKKSRESRTSTKNEDKIASVAPASVATVSSNGTKEVDGISWSWPAQGKIISNFKAGKNRGVDISGTKGQKIFAAADGTVLHKGNMNGYGNLVIIKHSDGVLSAYAHNDKVVVKEKQQVKRGQQIAEMGNTDSEKIKLHFEIRYQGKPVDPMKYLPD